MNTENNLKEPTLEEYGLDASSYENYRSKKNNLEKLKADCVISYSSLGYLIILGAFLAGLIFQSGIVVVLGVVVGGMVAFIENNKEKEIIKKRNGFYDEIELIKNKVLPFENDSIKYYQDYLENFFRNNLYKKRSGSEKFEQSLIEFAAILDEVEEINKKLIFANVQHYYRSYLSSRQTDHKYQKNKNFKSFDDIKVEIDEKLEQEKEIAKDSTLNLKEKTEEKFGDILDMEISEDKNYFSVKKEDIPKDSPEKKYRIARKIDNWEDINRKRKFTGDKGEETVLGLEIEYLESINKNDLASRVSHVSKEKGDGLGYDILSFFGDGKEKYIEVKSTTTSINSAFNISKNELDFLKENPENAFIYRVSFYNEAPEIEVKTSSEILESDITPTSYLVKTRFVTKTEEK